MHARHWLVIAAVAAMVLLVWALGGRRAASEPVEYYAQDWIVLDQKRRTVCKDPYIRVDVKMIQCISADEVR